MTFLVILCEGYAEMDFVGQVLSNHLGGYGIICHQELFGKKIKHDIPEAPGGILKYEPVYKHINAALRQYSAETSYVTTMIDFYAFPQDFPGYAQLVTEPVAAERVIKFEEAMFSQMGRTERFIPNIQLHEFEALIYARLEELRAEFGDDQLALDGLDRLIASVKGLLPEEINQTKEGAPSKRLLAHVPYDKRAMGHKIVRQIGLENLKVSCPHFGKWLERLEALGSKPH